MLFQTLLWNFSAAVECRICGLQHVSAGRDKIGHILCRACISRIEFPSWAGFAVICNFGDIHIYGFFFFFNLWFKWLKQLQQMNISTLLQKNGGKKKEKRSHHFHPDTPETVICYQIAGSLQFLGSFRISDSRWIPSSGGYWYCKPGPSVSNSSLSVVIQSLPVITVVSQYKLRAAKEEYKCVNTSALSWISWISPFSGVHFICNSLVQF